MNVLRESLLESLSAWLRPPAGTMPAAQYVARAKAPARDLISDLANFLTDDQLLDVLRTYNIVEDDNA